MWSGLELSKEGQKLVGNREEDMIFVNRQVRRVLPIINFIKPPSTETVDPRLLAEQGKKELTVKRM